MLKSLPFRFDTNLGWQSVLAEAHDRLSTDGWMGRMHQLNPNDFTPILGNPAYSEVSLGDNVDRYDFYLWDMHENGYDVEAERKLYRDMLANHRFWGMVPIEEEGAVLVDETGERITLRKGQYVFVLEKETVDDQVFRSVNAVLDGLRRDRVRIGEIVQCASKLTDIRYNGLSQLLGALTSIFPIIGTYKNVRGVPDLYLSHITETFVWDCEKRCWVLNWGRNRYDVKYERGELSLKKQTDMSVSEYIVIKGREAQYFYIEHSNLDVSDGVTFESGGKKVEIKVNIN